MKHPILRFYDFVREPVRLRSRIILAVLIVPLILAFTAPLWSIYMLAPQYPEGLSLDIFAYKVEGGRDGLDIQEINVLNHYIGMAPIDEVALADLDWIPFAIGVLMILTLRVAAIGDIRSLIDLTVITGYFSVFAFGRFVYKLWVLGHNLDPKAPVTIDGFMPAVFGTKQIANFTVTSLPELGSIYMAVFAVGVGAVTVWHLWVGRREAQAVEKIGSRS